MRIYTLTSKPSTRIVLSSLPPAESKLIFFIILDYGARPRCWQLSLLRLLGRRPTLISSRSFPSSAPLACATSCLTDGGLDSRISRTTRNLIWHDSIDLGLLFVLSARVLYASAKAVRVTFAIAWHNSLRLRLRL